MTNERHHMTRLGSWAMALMLLLGADVLAQTATPRITDARTDNMQLWSFGDCARRFPYVETSEHRECVRVVGSPEARDARAHRVCEVSHGLDRAEIERCKATYQANKERSVREGVAAMEAEVSSPETMSRVRAITSAATEAKPVAASATARPAKNVIPEVRAQDVEPESSSIAMVGPLLLLVAFLGYRVTVGRRKQTQSA